MKNDIKKILIKYSQFIKFSVVGAINTGVDFAVFSIALFVIPHINEVFAQSAGYMSGLAASFFLNKYVTFKNNTKALKQVVLFLLYNLLTMIISMIGIYVFHSILGIQEHVAKLLLITPITMIINYFSYKFVVFPGD